MVTHLIRVSLLHQLEDEGRDGIDKEELYRILDEKHNRFGATLLEKWGFAERYILITMYHDYLEKVDPISKELLVVHSANLLVKSMGYCISHQSETDLENSDSVRMLKLDSVTIAEVKKRVQQRMDELSKIFS